MLTRGPTQRGFTLVELMVTLALMGVTLAFAVPAFGQLSANYRVRAAGESLLSALHLARAEAVRRNAPVTFTLVGTRAGWSVTDGAGTVIRSRSDSDKATLAVAASNAASSVTFLPTGLVATTGTRISQLSVTSSYVGTDSRRLDVMGGGLIRLCSPQVSAANDLRRC